MIKVGAAGSTPLYTLAAEGTGRRSCQILNEKDNCCYAFNGDNFWVPKVATQLEEMNEPGQFSFFFDRSAPFHKVSAVAANKIYEEIRQAFGREGRKL